MSENSVIGEAVKGMTGEVLAELGLGSEFFTATSSRENGAFVTTYFHRGEPLIQTRLWFDDEGIRWTVRFLGEEGLCQDPQKNSTP